MLALSPHQGQCGTAGSHYRSFLWHLQPDSLDSFHDLKLMELALLLARLISCTSLISPFFTFCCEFERLLDATVACY